MPIVEYQCQICGQTGEVIRPRVPSKCESHLLRYFCTDCKQHSMKHIEISKSNFVIKGWKTPKFYR